MGRYVLRRLAESAVTFVLVTIVVFLGIRALPGDPAPPRAGEESDTPNQAEIRQSLGQGQPHPEESRRLLPIARVQAYPGQAKARVQLALVVPQRPE